MRVRVRTSSMNANICPPINPSVYPFTEEDKEVLLCFIVSFLVFITMLHLSGFFVCSSNCLLTCLHIFLCCDCIQLIAQIFRTLFNKTALCLPQTELTKPIKLTWHLPVNLFDSSVIPAHQGKWLMVHGIGLAQIIPVNKWFTFKHRKQENTQTATNAFPLWVLHYMLGC